MTRKARLALSRRTLNPPDPSRIGGRRAALTPKETALFERIAAATLRRFGHV